MVEASKGNRRTIYESAPESFTLPVSGRAIDRDLPDVVFRKDHATPGLYRANIDPKRFFTEIDRPVKKPQRQGFLARTLKMLRN